MAKCNAEELSAKINALEIEDDVKIALMEDIADSISPEENAELDSLKEELLKKETEFKELKNRYIARFLNAVETEEPEKEEGYAEDTVIDVKEI